MKTIILATKNAGKVREFRDLTGGFCEVLTMAEAGIHLDIEETGTTFAENASIKARAVWEARAAAGFYDTVISDDSGIEIDFLDKKPGIYSSRWLAKTLLTPKKIKLCSICLLRRPKISVPPVMSAPCLPSCLMEVRFRYWKPQRAALPMKLKEKMALDMILFF